MFVISQSRWHRMIVDKIVEEFTICIRKTNISIPPALPLSNISTRFPNVYPAQFWH